MQTGRGPHDSSGSPQPNAALLGEGGLQLRVGVSPAIPPGIVEADGQEPYDSSGSPEPNAVWLKKGASRSPHPCFDSPAAWTSLSLVMPVLLIVRSCCPCCDHDCLSFACSRRHFYPVISRCSKTISYLPNPSARAGYDTRSVFKRSLTGLNSEFSFS